MCLRQDCLLDRLSCKSTSAIFVPVASKANVQRGGNLSPLSRYKHLCSEPSRPIRFRGLLLQLDRQVGHQRVSSFLQPDFCELHGSTCDALQLRRLLDLYGRFLKPHLLGDLIYQHDFSGCGRSFPSVHVRVDLEDRDEQPRFLLHGDN